MNDQNQLVTQPKIQRASRSLHGFFILRCGSVWKKRLKISKFATFESNMLEIWLRRVAEFRIVETSFHPPPPASPPSPRCSERTARQEERSKERAGERERRSSLSLVLLLLSLFVCFLFRPPFCAVAHNLNTWNRRMKRPPPPYPRKKMHKHRFQYSGEIGNSKYAKV